MLYCKSILFLLLFSMETAFAQAPKGCSVNKQIIEQSTALLLNKAGKLKNNDSLEAYRWYKRAKKCYYSQKYDSVLFYLAKSKPLFRKLGFAYDYVWCSLLSVNICKTMANYPKAFEFLKEAEQSVKEFPGIKKQTLGNIYSYYGIMYVELGFLDESLKYFLLELEFYKVHEPENLPKMNVIYNNLGQIYLLRGDLEKAFENYQLVLKIIQDHPEIPEKEFHNTYHGLGNYYSHKGDLSNAFDFHQKALAIRIRVFGENHSETAGSYNDIGNLYEEKEDNIDAENYYMKSYEIRKKIFGIDHPLVIASVMNLVNIYANNGKNERSVDSLLKAVDRVKNKYGYSHLLLQGLYSNIGNNYIILKKFSQARTFLENSLKITYPIYGKKSTEASIDLKILGILYGQISIYSDSIPEKTSINVSLNYFQDALCALAMKFNSRNIYTNPRLEEINSQPDLLNVLTLKGDMLVRRWEMGKK